MAGKKKTQRMWITLECQALVEGTKCAERNYVTTKNKRNTPDRIERHKYCPHCRLATAHKETK